MDTTSQDTATLDELNRSIKDIHVAVERALSLHIPPNQIKSIVAVAVREGMKTDLGEAVKSAMAGHSRPRRSEPSLMIPSERIGSLIVRSGLVWNHGEIALSPLLISLFTEQSDSE